MSVTGSPSPRAGLRIEDDVAVTEHGHENLTAAALKAPAALER